MSRSYAGAAQEHSSSVAVREGPQWQAVQKSPAESSRGIHFTTWSSESQLWAAHGWRTILQRPHNLD